jgi:hypothetical protein
MIGPKIVPSGGLDNFGSLARQCLCLSAVWGVESRSARIFRSVLHTIMNSTFTCPSCGAKTVGQFCSACGEKEITERDYSLGHYLQEIITAVTLLESKALRSLWLVVSKPGFLSNEYFSGRRVVTLSHSSCLSSSTSFTTSRSRCFSLQPSLRRSTLSST